MKCDVRTYTDLGCARRATALRSLLAAQRGEMSQAELRRSPAGDGFVGGAPGELQRRFPHWSIVGQWSAGYTVE